MFARKNNKSYNISWNKNLEYIPPLISSTSCCGTNVNWSACQTSEARTIGERAGLSWGFTWAWLGKGVEQRRHQSSHISIQCGKCWWKMFHENLRYLECGFPLGSFQPPQSSIPNITRAYAEDVIPNLS